MSSTRLKIQDFKKFESVLSLDVRDLSRNISENDESFED